MGLTDLYPFVLSKPAIAKLGFVHDRHRERGSCAMTTTMAPKNDVFHFCGVVRSRIEIKNTDQHRDDLRRLRSGAFFDEMFEARARRAPAAARARPRFIDALPRRRAAAPPARRRARAARAWASRSTSTATTPAPSGSSRSTSSRASSRRAEWRRIERGLKQRIHALNLFIDDIYHEQQIVKDGVVPRELIARRRATCRQCVGLEAAARHLVPHHRHRPGARHATASSTCSRTTCAARPACRYVLREPAGDEADVPAGLRAHRAIRPVDDYPSRLLEMLQYLAPHGRRSRRVVVLTPGIYNSAYFEHSFLAQQMGVELVEGRDLVVVGRLRLHADDARASSGSTSSTAASTTTSSTRGVPAGLDARRARADGRLPRGQRRAGQRARHRHRRRQGRLRLRAEDHQVLPGRGRRSCPTCRRTSAADETDRALRAGAPRRAGREGGQRVRRLRHADRPARDAATSARSSRERIQANPRNYIAQPTLALSRVPTHRRTTASRAGTSTCGRTSSTARTSTCCPAG